MKRYKKLPVRALQNVLVVTLLASGMVACDKEAPEVEPVAEPVVVEEVVETVTEPEVIALPPVTVIKGEPSGLVAAIEIPSATLFAFDKSDLTDDGKAAIEEYRAALSPELSEAYEVIILGYTDNVGSTEYNIGLAERRAKAVSNYLAGTGVDASKLHVLDMGESEPIASNDTEEGRAENRRVEIIVIGELRAMDKIRFASVALFPSRSAELTATGKALLENSIADAQTLLNRAVFIKIIGHTDNIGEDSENMELSEQRAAAVSQYLIEAGVNPNKILAIGAGESQPVATNDTEEGRAENRRVEIQILGRLNKQVLPLM
ncbi:MAG: OmpA family protein [gamma proteobacterium symbiont of Bathyaustriella thionipta]|nr:OmpA family protein [gamma proteobacterium symbiont of Bathyaustriella thionipta]